MQHLTIETAIRGTIIQDETGNELYLILEHCKERKSLRCLDRKFNEVGLGTDWIGCYYIYDTLDMDVFIEIISERVEGG